MTIEDAGPQFDVPEDPWIWAGNQEPIEDVPTISAEQITRSEEIAAIAEGIR